MHVDYTLEFQRFAFFRFCEGACDSKYEKIVLPSHPESPWQFQTLSILAMFSQVQYRSHMIRIELPAPWLHLLDDQPHHPSAHAAISLLRTSCVLPAFEQLSDQNTH